MNKPVSKLREASEVGRWQAVLFDLVLWPRDTLLPAFVLILAASAASSFALP